MKPAFAGDNQYRPGLPRLVPTESRHIRHQNVEIWGSGHAFTWNSAAREIFLHNAKHKARIDALFCSKAPEDNLIGFLLVSRFEWRGNDGFVPRVLAPPNSLPVKKAFKKQVENTLQDHPSWEAKVGALVYFYGFPDLINEKQFLTVFDPLANWGKYSNADGQLEVTCLSEYVLNSKSPEWKKVKLGLIAMYVYANAFPEKGLEYSLDKLQGKPLWDLPIANTRAAFSVNQKRMSRICDTTVRTRLGFVAASSMESLSHSYHGFQNTVFYWGDIEFPSEFLASVLNDPVASKKFRSEMHSRSFWFQIKGITVDWRKATDKAIIENLAELYRKQRSKSLQVPRDTPPHK